MSWGWVLIPFVSVNFSSCFMLFVECFLSFSWAPPSLNRFSAVLQIPPPPEKRQGKKGTLLSDSPTPPVDGDGLVYPLAPLLMELGGIHGSRDPWCTRERGGGGVTPSPLEVVGKSVEKIPILLPWGSGRPTPPLLFAGAPDRGRGGVTPPHPCPLSRTAMKFLLAFFSVKFSQV